MLNFMENVEALPVADWTANFVEWLTDTFAFLFDPIKDGLGDLMDMITSGLDAIPPVIFILLVAILAFFMTGKKFGLAVFSIVGLLFIWNQGLWDQLIDTFTLVLTSSILCIIIGIPIGILMSKSKIAQTIITPILDFMQTMPAFVYLIPAVAFFSIGVVPGIFASLIFATPPTVRFTNLGIRQVSEELVEAADAFGSTGPQKLFKVELPMAKYTIMAGINQTVMLALSMVVIASMIGAPGLGREVLSSLQRAQVGPGFVAGLSIVVLAIIIDRFTQNIYKDRK
ncbi:glycine/betaine ABC transporter [Terribacillus saccharophilus]|jgi:glycine betaine/proline transport system permease protein|uniref:Glycine/betaine ABC transporter n=1 Tax=Terribacillus saccharophilus TaxID=361277 RepID=A0A268H8E7_9BACI|nr:MULTISPECIES: proline/glycine betaine ABC transporter permease [Terribacillus]PAD35039.1 glycine/betaine ABC transporter [Terribacillus saccharophilus]PAD95751.1 glycine/betaine ABC transporter [Terribacillus saccharophilus]PAD99321.1 glycine/betaine ABC transporter [Terribacillus saccharophilus]PAE06146.1 glycine/betaine ABC transporter [Terribacillus saccharophilus]